MPYQAFGCDMRSEFSGTLFRFPLRTPEAAAQSQISTQVHYSRVVTQQYYRSLVCIKGHW